MRPVDDRGASAVEYGLMLAAVAALIIGAAFAIGSITGGLFTHTSICLVNEVEGC
jgi:pilus assembly protein Flp/PilA